NAVESTAALLHLCRAFSVTVEEQAKLLEVTKWDKLPEGEWLRQDPKGMKKCDRHTVSGPTSEEEFTQGNEGLVAAIDKRASQPAAAWKMLLAARRAVCTKKSYDGVRGRLSASDDWRATELQDCAAVSLMSAYVIKIIRIGWNVKRHEDQGGHRIDHIRSRLGSYAEDELDGMSIAALMMMLDKIPKAGDVDSEFLTITRSLAYQGFDLTHTPELIWDICYRD
ncbi:hypothetical protein FOZ60_010282, partial [Perkinsus olseni]